MCIYISVSIPRKQINTIYKENYPLHTPPALPSSSKTTPTSSPSPQ